MFGCIGDQESAISDPAIKKQITIAENQSDSRILLLIWLLLLLLLLLFCSGSVTQSKSSLYQEVFLWICLPSPRNIWWACACSHILYIFEVCIQCNSAKLYMFGPSSLQQRLTKAYIIRKVCHVSRWQQTGMSCVAPQNGHTDLRYGARKKKFWFVAQQIPCGHNWLSENKLSVLFIVRMVTSNSPLHLWFFRFFIVLHYFCEINQCKEIQTWNIICAPSWVDFLMQPVTLQSFSSQLKTNGSFQKTRHTLTILFIHIKHCNIVLQDQGI